MKIEVDKLKYLLLSWLFWMKTYLFDFVFLQFCMCLSLLLLDHRLIISQTDYPLECTIPRIKQITSKIVQVVNRNKNCADVDEAGVNILQNSPIIIGEEFP